MRSDPRRSDARAALSVVVVNYNSVDLLRRNLVAVADAIPEASIVIVDNFSSAAEAASVARLSVDRGWSFVLRPDNGGFGAGVNAGVACARDLGRSRFLLLNPDATIDGASVDRLLAAVDAQPLIVAAPRVVTTTGEIWFSGVDLVLSDGTMRASAMRADFPDALVEPWLTGASLMVTETVWQRVGEFDEDYFLYWEDVDYSFRVARAGGTLAIVDEAIAVHDEGGTQSPTHGRAKSDGYYYYNIRNRLLFAAKHLPPAMVRRWQRTSVAAAREVLLRGGRRQFLHSLRPLWTAGRALRAGRRFTREALSRPTETSIS